jgi:hypothetical protein
VRTLKKVLMPTERESEVMARRSDQEGNMARPEANEVSMLYMG